MEKLTTQVAIRRAFWAEYPEASRKKITDYSGKGKMYTTDTRSLFCLWLDEQNRAGRVSDKLAFRATL